MIITIQKNQYSGIAPNPKLFNSSRISYISSIFYWQMAFQTSFVLFLSALLNPSMTICTHVPILYFFQLFIFMLRKHYSSCLMNTFDKSGTSSIHPSINHQSIHHDINPQPLYYDTCLKVIYIWPCKIGFLK